MGKIYLGDIQDVGYFMGTEDQLDEIIGRSKEREWSNTKVGAATVITFSRGDSMFWWEDTGDVVFRGKNVRSAGTDFKKGAENLTEKINFRVVKKGKYPAAEQFFRDPQHVLWNYFEEEFARREHDAVVLIIARGANIVIPKRHPAKWEVVHQWSPKGSFCGDNNEYLGFQVRQKNSKPQRFRGQEIVDGFIDLTLPYFMANFGPKTKGKRTRALNEGVRSLMREYDKIDNSPWDKKQCVSFFADDNNFV